MVQSVTNELLERTYMSTGDAAIDLSTSFVKTIAESNRQAIDAWTRFAPHRHRVQTLLAGLASPSSSLCILGGGNLNDVCVDELLDQFATVDIVDLDVVTVGAALRRHGVDARANCRVQGPIDLTGILARLPATADEMLPGIADGLVDALGTATCRIVGSPFDVVISTGVLTQLLQSVVDSALPPDGTTRVTLALRDHHLADLVAMTRSGGTLVLVTDVVSTSTAPRLATVTDEELVAEMAATVSARNFFTGTNPYRIAAMLEEDPRLGDLVTDVELFAPWLWAVTADRQHLTCAIVARRR